jgi:hypothetical protein
VLYACCVPPTGLVYRIKGPNLPQACLSKDHVEFSWINGLAEGVRQQAPVRTAVNSNRGYYN